VRRKKKNSPLRRLKKALAAGAYQGEPGQLINGAPLIMEDLAIPKGLYRESERDPNALDDYELFGGWAWNGELLYYRKSEDHVKVFEDRAIKLHKDLVKK
jgi:hypothetical protein